MHRVNKVVFVKSFVVLSALLLCMSAVFAAEASGQGNGLFGSFFQWLGINGQPTVVPVPAATAEGVHNQPATLPTPAATVAGLHDIVGRMMPPSENNSTAVEAHAIPEKMNGTQNTPLMGCEAELQKLRARVAELEARLNISRPENTSMNRTAPPRPPENGTMLPENRTAPPRLPENRTILPYYPNRTANLPERMPPVPLNVTGINRTREYYNMTDRYGNRTLPPPPPGGAITGTGASSGPNGAE